VARSIAEYVEERERECKALSLHHSEEPTYAVEASSDGKRGRVVMVLGLTERATLAISELVEVQSDYVHRLEYGYYLIIDGQEYCARDFDSFHGYHGHTIGHERVEADRISFKAAGPKPPGPTVFIQVASPRIPAAWEQYLPAAA
jgi:hypothetical protein